MTLQQHIRPMSDEDFFRNPPYRNSIAGTLFRAREAVMEPLRPILREADVTEPQWRVLRVLASEGELSSSTLSEEALLHAPSVTRILRQLELRKLVVRYVDEADGRRTIIAITPRGRKFVDRVWAAIVEVIDSYSNSFGKKRLQKLMSELDALTISLSKE